MSICQYALVTVQKIKVHKSEEYSTWGLGLDGEPGNSAEWDIQVTVAGNSRSFYFDVVRDNSVLTINQPFLVNLNSQQESLRIEISGVEIDNTSANDTLPRAEVIITPSTNWSDGQTFEGSASSSDFNYTFTCDVRCADIGSTSHALTVAVENYSCIWTKGSHAQVWWPSCSEKELRDKIGELWGSMRLAQIQAFLIPGEVRYSAIWNKGTYPQVWWPNCSEKELRDKIGELWGSMRLVQMQAFVVGGEVRYSAIWNKGTYPQVWWPNCSEKELRDKIGELWGSMRLVQMQAFVVGGEVRYSAIWNPGTYPQVWWPNCSEKQLRDETSETWDDNMRLTQMQAFVF